MSLVTDFQATADHSLCFSAHDTGLVTLQVAVNNQIISNSVVFEYKARALPTLPSSQHDWLSLDGKISEDIRFPCKARPLKGAWGGGGACCAASSPSVILFARPLIHSQGQLKELCNLVLSPLEHAGSWLDCCCRHAGCHSAKESLHHHHH